MGGITMIRAMARSSITCCEIGAAQCYPDPLKARINDVQELSKAHEAIAELTG
jgi:hypothetical protein